MAGNKEFNENRTVYGFVMRIFDLVLLNLVFLVCCIPVITIGASFTALYSMTLKMVKNEEPGLFSGFFSAFKENFKQSIPMTLLFLLLYILIFVDLYILGHSEGSAALVMFGGGVALLLMVTAVAGYAFPLLAKFDNTVKNTLANAVKIAVSHLPWTILILAINVAPFVWLYFSPETFVDIAKFWMPIGGAGAAFINSIFLNKIFAKFITEE